MLNPWYALYLRMASSADTASIVLREDAEDTRRMYDQCRSHIMKVEIDISFRT